jgi:sarcosine oxidase
MISSPDSGGIHNVKEFYENCVNAARQYEIKHDLLSAADIRRLFPQFRVRDDERAYYEYEAGVLYPERCIDVQLKLAEKYGAEIRRNQKATALEQTGDGVKVSTAGGDYTAEQLILSAGPWLQALIGQEAAPLFSVVRQVLHWFDVSSCYEQFEPGKFPIFIWEMPGHSMYGFPAMSGAAGGFKIGAAEYNQSVTADSVNREVGAEEGRIVYEQQIAPFFTPPAGPCIKSKVCLYTVTPDSAFVIDRVPGMPSVLLCSPCSGHGFKHTASIGEAIAQIVLDGQSKLDLSSFKLARFAGLAQTS